MWYGLMFEKMLSARMGIVLWSKQSFAHKYSTIYMKLLNANSECETKRQKRTMCIRMWKVDNELKSEYMSKEEH